MESGFPLNQSVCCRRLPSIHHERGGGQGEGGAAAGGAGAGGAAVRGGAPRVHLAPHRGLRPPRHPHRAPLPPPRPQGGPSVPQSVFTITEKAPIRAFSWLKAPTSAFTFKTLLRHYAKQTLTPQ